MSVVTCSRQFIYDLSPDVFAPLYNLSPCVFQVRHVLHPIGRLWEVRRGYKIVYHHLLSWKNASISVWGYVCYPTFVYFEVYAHSRILCVSFVVCIAITSPRVYAIEYA